MADRDNGKKIDEWRIDGNNAVLRWNSHKYEFCLEVYGMIFRGESARTLRSDAEIALKKYDKLAWKPVIIIDTDPKENLGIHFQRMYQAKDSEGTHCRYWRCKGETKNERGYGWSSPDTENILEGEPGDIMNGRETSGKTVPYTAERWMQLQALVAALKIAIEKAREKLGEILKGKDLDGFLENVAKGVLPALSFSQDGPRKP